MKTIIISGIIGWDATAEQLREDLKAAAGEDIEVILSTPGGLVGEGLEMFNLLRNYPGQCTGRLSGYVMSMGSYLAMAMNRVVAEDNAIYMIHNVHGGVFGDHNYILRYGNTTKAMSALLGRAYAKRTGKPLEEISVLMDEETYYFGEDIVDAGFADEIISVDGEHDGDSALAMARVAFDGCTSRMAADLSAVRNDLNRAAALAGAQNNNHQTRAQANAAPATKGARAMNLEQLKAEHPDLVAAIVAEAQTGMVTNENLKSQIATAATEGAANELQRINDVRAQSIPGHEALIEQLAFDGKSTGADAAKAIVAAEQAKVKSAAAAIDTDANPPAPAANGDGAGQQSMKRKDFNALSQAEQRKVISAGTRIVD